LIYFNFYVFPDIILPEKRRLNFCDKVPPLPVHTKAPKSFKRIELMRGPELIHNELIHKQYGIVVSNLNYVLSDKVQAYLNSFVGTLWWTSKVRPF
jgi:hypothetical protein